MTYEKQIWNQYDDLKTEEENIENGAVVTDNRMNHIEEGIEAHTTDFKNPHKVTAAQVGLGNVPNYAAATKEEALAGESNGTIMTPSLTKAAAKSYVTKEDVGLSDVTNDEQATKTEFNAHTANKSNPHSVTAGQVGAYSKSEADNKLALKANDSEVVHKTGDETIDGIKTFSNDIIFKGDVPWTTLPLNDGFSGNLQYQVKAGVAYISAAGLGIPAIQANTWTAVANLPDILIPSTNRITTGYGNGTWALLANTAGSTAGAPRSFVVRSSTAFSASANLINGMLIYPVG